MPYLYGTKLQAGQNIVHSVLHAQGVKPSVCPRQPGADSIHWHDSAYAPPGAVLPSGAAVVAMRDPHAAVEGDTDHLARRRGTAPIKYHYSVHFDGTTRRVFMVWYAQAHNSGRDSSESVAWYGGCNELYEHVTTDAPPLVYSTGLPAGAVLIASR